LKRVLTQKVKPISTETTEGGRQGESIKPISVLANRRVRRRAATIGLAISMGASSLLLPRQGDRAIAAPAREGSPVSTVSAPALEAAIGGETQTQPAIAAEMTQPKSGAIAKEARAGQTVRRLIQPTSSSLGEASSLPSLMGREHQAPSKLSTNRGREAIAAGRVESSPWVANEESSSINDRAIVPHRVNQLLRPRQNTALNSQREASNRISDSLAEWRSEESSNTVATESEPVLPSVIPGYTNSTDEAATESSEAFDGTPKVEVEPTTTTATEPTEENKKEITAELPQVIVPEPTAATPVAAVYKVQAGDTLSAIAQNYGLSTQDLAEANHMEDPDRLKIAQLISIPQIESSESAKNSTADELSARLTETSYIRPGQQLEQSEAMMTASAIVSTLPNTPSASTVTVAPSLSPDSASDAAAEVAIQPAPSFSGFDDNAPQIEFKGKVATGSTQTVEKTKQIAVAEAEEKTAQQLDENGEVVATKPKQNSNPYVERLREELSQLRLQYQNQHRFDRNNLATTPVPSPEPVKAAPVNPEFNPSRYNETSQSQTQRAATQQLQTPPQVQTPTRQPASRIVPQQIAVAPAGSEPYTIYNQRGQTVSPELPPLGDSDNYLPGGANRNFNGLIWPARGVLTSGYGPRWGRMHKGVDIAAPTGTPIYAAAPGVVVYARWNSGGYGNLVDIRHADGSMTRYAHNSRIFVQEGQVVEQGQHISAMGSTGFSTGPHLHFEVHPAGRGAANPMAFLPRRR
jgi:murein DD-endopeptidase MepM/ murein hydrolase activator NlpD